jgi:hypothetical protein
MHFEIKVSHFYDWKPVPPEVTVTPAQIKQTVVKPNKQGGGYLMRVPQPGPTSVIGTISELMIMEHIIDAHLHDFEMLTRSQAAARALHRVILPTHVDLQVKVNWVTDASVHDDPYLEEAAFRAKIADHISAGSILEEHAEQLVEAYRTVEDTTATVRAKLGLKDKVAS